MSVERPHREPGAESGDEPFVAAAAKDAIRRDPAVCQDELPDDLLELAAQLGEDAALLASSYPADDQGSWLGQSEATPERAARRWHRGMGWGIAAAGLAAVTVIGIWTLRDRGGAVPHLPSAELPRADAVENRVVLNVEKQSLPAESESPASPIVPTSTFEALSGPEQEALLDVMEDEGLDQPSLSI